LAEEWLVFAPNQKSATLHAELVSIETAPGRQAGALERDPIKCNRITLQIPLIVAQSFGEPLTLRRTALQALV